MILEEALKRAAYKVWEELEPIETNSNIKIFEVREEALTTMALKELLKSSCDQIESIKMISGSEESVKGYDFELVIGSKTKGRFIRFFVQEKRLYGKKVRNNYDALDFSQTEDLINYAKTNTSLALYAFYNHLNENSATLESHYNSITPFDKKSLGITVCSAYSVKMLNTRKFSDFHFNDYFKIHPHFYTLRHFPHLFYFHKDTRKHLAVPFHELSYFTIEMAETINKLYRKIKKSGRLSFFFFFPFGIEDYFEDEDLIPILNSSIEKLEEEFKERKQNNVTKTGYEIYNPEALIIINTDEK
jgi:hypothetical protein